MELRAYLMKPDTSGLGRLKIAFYNNKTKHWISTKLKVNPDAWDQVNQRVKSNQSQYKILNEKLTRLKADISKAIVRIELDNIEVTGEAVRELLRPARAVKNKPFTVSDLLLQFIENNKSTKAKSYTRKFKTIAGHVADFAPKIRANDFTLEVYQNYLNYLIEDLELENNTVHDHVRKIRLVLQIADQKGLINNKDYMDFRYRYISPKPFWLSWEEVEAIEQFIPLDDKDAVYKDEFLFRCYTGLRFSDAHGIKKSNIIKSGHDTYLDFSVVKTRLGQNILLSKSALALLKKWNYNVPKLSMSECNKRIKEIARPALKQAEIKDVVEKVRYRGNERLVSMLPKWEMVTTHVARRTFARRWMDLGGDIAKLSVYLGHSSIKQTSQYIGYETKEVNDEMRRLFG